MPKKQTKTFRVPDERSLSVINEIDDWLYDITPLFGGGEIKLSAERPNRALAQNRAYWGFCLRPIRIALQERGTPVSSAALHEHFKAALLDPEPVGEVVNPVTGEVTMSYKPPSTASLDSTEFYEYVERIKQTEWVQYLQVPFDHPRLREMILGGSMIAHDQEAV